MIAFFRRIRQQLLSKNHISRYLLYAIGEIALVMIGILLALQVNNWNEEQKERKREISYLQRLQENLNTDLEILDLNLAFYAQVFDYGQVALDYSNGIQNNSTSDWEVLVSFFHASQIWPVIASASTYEELKSAGELSLIQSTELRNKMSFYYGGGQIRYQQTVGIIPSYRKKARGLIPHDIQNYLWEHCHITDGDLQILTSCSPGAHPERIQNVLRKLADDTELIADLNFYMSSIKVGEDTILEQRKLCARMLEEIGGYLP
ncbi:DUF6090 family protein [Robiginitalea sp. IMCC43444]|uniref:DUF6090 family protein n=1 Tax=Robiginitalea sp. IMCC43444 TaxID=3459121 RepID=UPI0040425895